jgi:hypothetical protein
MDAVFTNSLRTLQRRHRAFGLSLRPLTVGHLFLLIELENAYPESPKEAGESDLFTAVLVCSQPHARARKMLESSWAPLWMWIWGKACKRLDWREEAKAFGEYLREQLARPEPDRFSTGEEARVPLAWRLQAMLMAEFCPNRKESLDAPVSWALTLWATESDRRGVSRVASDRQRVFREWVREQEAERLEAEAREAEANYMADEGKGDA